MKNKFILAILILLINSCSIISDFDSNEYAIMKSEMKNLSIILSHNINGELEPCGCRQHPLGGLHNVAGLLENLKSDSELLQVDSGDTFFPSNIIPSYVENSQKYTAQSLASALSLLGVKYILPGDQDFAGGYDFFKTIIRKSKIKILISNLKDKTLAHKRLLVIQRGPNKIFIAGFTNPSVMQSQYQSLFYRQTDAIKIIREDLKKMDYDKSNKFHRLILLTHNGRDNDEILAKEFPEIDWILGSHSQSFLKNPYIEGKTKLVQVLSRNHYIGELKISLTENKKKDKWLLHQVEEKLEKNLKDNPFISYINQHKSKLAEIQKEEQSKIVIDVSDAPTVPIRTFNDCMECHQKQTDFWSQTSHSLAYLTLVKSQKETDLQCVKCHSVGLNEKNGWKKIDHMINFNITHSHENYEHEHETNKDPKEHLKEIKKIKKDYWREVFTSIKNDTSIRSMSNTQRLKAKQKWMKIDEKFKVKHNYSGVQCLNCHNQHPDHPFVTDTEVVKNNDMKSKCLNCHTTDQSPEWYLKDKNGIAKNLNEQEFNKMYYQVACPKD